MAAGILRPPGNQALSRNREKAMTYVRAAEPAGEAGIETRSIGEAHGLTGSEQAVFDLMLRGGSVRTVARELGTSETVIRSRYRTILRKLNAVNGREVVERVWQWELAVSRLLGEPGSRVLDQCRAAKTIEVTHQPTAAWKMRR
jgi:DNA-binding NarL/FixJ family response regulator